MCRARARNSCHRVRAGVRSGGSGDGRWAVRDGFGRNVLVFLHAAPAADRFYLSAALDHIDLSHAYFCELRPGAGATATDSLGVWPVSFARAGGAARAIAGKTR